jgi:hypothetical protein
VSDSILLVCAVLASLTAGVLVAYGVCVAMFHILGMHAAQAAVESERRVAAATQIVEG